MPRTLLPQPTWRRLVALATLAAVLSGCAIPTRTARLEPTAEPSEIEEQARRRLETTSCSPAWSWLLPGLGQLCMGETGEGAFLTTLTAAEIGAAIALSNADLPDNDGLYAPESLPFLALQNVWMYGISDIYLEEDRAQQLPFTPQDTLSELIAAPFNLEVLSEPDVWGGILGLTAAAFAFSALRSLGDDNQALAGASLGANASYFGEQMHPAAAYPLAFATGTVLFSHVAIGEETLFRGVIQSSIARAEGEWAGWAYGSLVFGAIHIPNAAALPADEREDYLFYSIPFITAVGSYLGLSYKWNDYSLAHPVALHFWYDFLLSAAQYAASPGDSPIGMSYTIPF